MKLSIESPSRPDLALGLAATSAEQAAIAVGGEAIVALSGGELSVGLVEPNDSTSTAFRAVLVRSLGPAYEVVEVGDRLMIEVSKPAAKTSTATVAPPTADKGNGR